MAIACQNQPQKSRKLFPKAVKYLPILIYEDSDQIVCPTDKQSPFEVDKLNRNIFWRY